MEHDTLEYILKIKKMEKELFTIQTDRFTKVSGLTTENMVRNDSNLAQRYVVFDFTRVWANFELKKGTYTYPNGDTYEGNWTHDLRNGTGTYTYA